MTDAETYAAICADFPFDTATLKVLSERLQALREKVKPRFHSNADGTIAEVDWQRLNILSLAMRDLAAAMEMVETDGNPDDWIPF